MRNHLICWEENGTKKWEMVSKKDSNDFLLELMQNPDVAQRTIFIKIGAWILVTLAVRGNAPR